MRHLSDDGNSGFTLIEVISAAVILTLGLGGLGVALVSASTSRESIGEQARVLSNAQGLLEEVRATTPSSVLAQYDGMSRILPAESLGGTETRRPPPSAHQVSPILCEYVRLAMTCSGRSKSVITIAVRLLESSSLNA